MKIFIFRGKKQGDLTAVFRLPVFSTMGCCCSKRKQFTGEGHRLGTAADDQDARNARAAAAERRAEPMHEPYTDATLNDGERARLREERLAAAEARMSKEEKKQMNQKKKKSDAPLRGPNSQNTMRWTAG
ncbi:hypothetical protein ACHAXN_005936 [Cyclotella atomus]|jgi:hypothetical protein